jgi:golgi-specific brefeldin A-resistance guanine nucleotide exchange factor 1
LIIRNTSLFDLHIFKLVWKQVISALGFAFTYYDDDYVVQRAISGFQQCAKLASRFKMPEVFDHIVSTVSPTTGLLDVSTPQTFNYATAHVEGQTLSVSPLSVHFGGNLKGQLAAVVLFRLVNGNADALTEGWKQVIPTLNEIRNTDVASDHRDLFKSLPPLHATWHVASKRRLSRWH